MGPILKILNVLDANLKEKKGNKGFFECKLLIQNANKATF